MIKPAVNQEAGLAFARFLNERDYLENKKANGRATFEHKVGPTAYLTRNLNTLMCFREVCAFGHIEIGRGDKIRTCDPLHPMQVRYQAAPRPDRTRMIAQKGLKILPRDSISGGGF